MSGFIKTPSYAREWLKARAVEYQSYSALAHAIIHTQQELLVQGFRPSNSTDYRTCTLNNMGNMQHTAGSYAAIARECLMASLRLREEAGGPRILARGRRRATHG